MGFIKAYNKFKIAFGLMIFALGSTVGSGLGSEIGLVYADEIAYDGHSQAGSYELNSSSYFDGDTRHMSVNIDVYSEADSEAPENYNYVVYINDNAVANGTQIIGEDNELDLDLSAYGAGEYTVKTDVSTSGGVMLSALEKVEITPVEDNNLVNEVTSASNENGSNVGESGSEYSNAYITDWGINSAYYGEDTPIRKNQKALEEMAETLDGFEYEYKDGDNVSESNSDSKYIMKDTTAEREAIERQSKIKYIAIGSVIVVLISLIAFVVIKKKKEAERKEEELLRKKIEFANKAKGKDEKAGRENERESSENEETESETERAWAENNEVKDGIDAAETGIDEAEIKEDKTEVAEKETAVGNSDDTLADIQAELDNIGSIEDDEVSDLSFELKANENLEDDKEDKAETEESEDKTEESEDKSIETEFNESSLSFNFNESEDDIKDTEADRVETEDETEEYKVKTEEYKDTEEDTKVSIEDMLDNIEKASDKSDSEGKSEVADTKVDLDETDEEMFSF